MCLVDDDVVKLFGMEIGQMLGNRRAHSKHAGSRAYILARLISVECIDVAQESFITRAGGIDNASAVCKKEDASGFGCQDVERRQEGFARAGCRYQQSAGLALAMDCSKCFESALLHFIGLNFFKFARG